MRSVWVLFLMNRDMSVLYHGSAHVPETAEYLLPAWSETAVCREYGELEQARHVGEFVFAVADRATACAYALKVCHPCELEAAGGGRVRPYRFSLQVLAFPEESLVVTVITRGKEFLEVLHSVPLRVFAMPGEGEGYRFERVYRRSGLPTDEFVSRSAVPLAGCSVTVLDFGACLEKVQVLFLDEMVSKREWLVRYAQVQVRDRIGFFAVMMKQGILVHVNREYGIVPFDFLN